MSEEEARYGTDWTGGKLDLIVADYFLVPPLDGVR